MESRFGHDFSRIRVHSGASADAMAKQAGALAYTFGRDIVFAQGQYSPGSKAGGELLAHELAHTIQQESPAASGAAPGAAETEAVAASISPDISFRVKHRTGSTIARQATSPNFFEPVRYGRDHFGDRFDAEVDPRFHRVKLIMGVDFTPVGFPSYIDTEQVIKKFAIDMKKVVEDTWSNRYALQSVCEADQFQPRVQLITHAQNAHATIYLHPDTPGGRSAAGDGASALQEGDNTAKEHTRYFDAGKGKPPREGNFYQTPSAHEFGHMIGLDHVRCKGNEDRCYGLTPEEAMDVMGVGSVVSKRDYKPFQDIMELYGKDRLPAGCNKWKLVEPNV